ncbi:MAG: DUF3570 domain-containing protein [Sandaracinaceae bacterium]|nr:DUF3570 domain-containing protein [Sandaracinaceae bacterium]
MTGRVRARLVVLLLAASGLSGLASADERVAVDGHYYLDSDQLEVWHPHASASVEMNEETRVTGSYDADVISAATVDVRTAASPRGFRESRHGVGLDLAVAPSSTLRYGVSTSGSFAPDFTSATGGARLAIEDDARIHTFAVSLSASYSSVGRVGDQSPTGDNGAVGASLGWTGVVSEALVLDLSAAAEASWGYLESPYRFVTIYDTASTRTLAVAERMPDLRLRGALMGRVRIAPTDDVFLRGSYRLHADDWGVLGHTAEVAISVAPVPELLVTLEGRYLGQRAASFYRGRYETLPEVPELRTRDRELAGSTTLSVAARVELSLPVILEGLPSVFVRGELTHTRLYDTWLLPERVAGVVGVGLTFVR